MFLAYATSKMFPQFLHVFGSCILKCSLKGFLGGIGSYMFLAHAFLNDPKGSYMFLAHAFLNVP